MALLEGNVTFDQFDSARWLDDDVKSLMSRIEFEIDPALTVPTPGALPCRLTAKMLGGEIHAAECRIPPGHPNSPMNWTNIVQKFNRCATDVLNSKAHDDVIEMVAHFEELLSIRPLVAWVPGALSKSLTHSEERE